ncbi:MAG: YkgJ family cysteine cluster protein [Bacteroidales bacterium]|nr:YkgJ family cysteine cluster protein [Bacteroidales bacterium]
MKCRLNTCRACCCYNIPFMNGELERYKDKIVTPVLFTEPMGPAVVAFTAYDPMLNKCPFLRDDYKCNIYENRPEVCRQFGQIEELPCKFRKK